MASTDNNRHLVILLLITGVFVLVFHRFWNHSIVYSDSFRYFAPNKFLIAEALKKGTVYFWNPWQYLGMPFVAEAQAGWFYPLNVLYLILPFEPAHRLFILIHYPLGAIFMYLFLKGRGVNRESSFMGAIVFALSGYMTSQHAYLSILIVSAWAPLAFYCIDRALSGAISWALGAGAVLAMQVFNGEPQIAAITALLIALICVGTAFTAPRRIVALKSLFAAFLSSIFLSAVQTLPTIEMTRLSARGHGMSYSDCALFSFHPARAIEIIWPLPFGTLWPEAYYWGRFALDRVIAPNPWSFTNYIGLPIIALALVGLFLSRRPWKVWLSAGMVFFFVLSLGVHTPVFAFLYRFLPFVRMFRYPEKYLAWFTLFTVAAASLGMEEILRLLAEKPSAVARGAIFYGLSIISCGVVAVFVWPMIVINVTALEPGSEEYRMILSNLAGGGRQWLAINLAVALIALLTAKKIMPAKRSVILVIFILSLDLYMSNVSMMPPGPAEIYDFPSPVAKTLSPDGHPRLGEFRITKFGAGLGFSEANPLFSNLPFVSRTALWLRFVLENNLHQMAGFEDMRGYNAIPPAAGLSLLGGQLNSRLVKLYNVKYIISSYKQLSILRGPSTETIFSDPGIDLAITRFPDTWPRSYWAPSAVTAKDEKEAAALLYKVDLKKDVVLTTEENIPAAEGGDRTMSPATIVSYEPDRVVIESNVDFPGWLVLSDHYYPGWVATVDGWPVTIYRANVMVRAVRLSAGRHKIEFRYRPSWFYIGGAISLPAWVFVIFWWAIAYMKREKRPATAI